MVTNFPKTEIIQAALSGKLVGKKKSSDCYAGVKGIWTIGTNLIVRTVIS